MESIPGMATAGIRSQGASEDAPPAGPVPAAYRALPSGMNRPILVTRAREVNAHSRGSAGFLK